MKSALETLNPTRVKLAVEVPFEELKPSLDAAYKTIAGQVAIPGFRPGKVPARLIEQRFGREAVLQEAVNQALPEMYAKAIDEHEVRPMGQPEVEITDLPVGTEDPLQFTVEVDVRPTVELPALDELTVTVDTVAEADIDAEADNRMTELRQRFKSLVGVHRAVQTGDFINLDLSAVIDGVDIDSVKNVSYEVGSGNMLEGLDDALVGMSAEETKTFQAPLAGGEHEGENADVTVRVDSVKIAELPELDDDFAQLASEFDTLTELRADVREQANRAKLLEQGVQARDRLLELLLEKVDIPLPESVIEDEVHAHLEAEGRLDDDEHRQEAETEARTSLTRQLLLDALGEQVEVQVTQQELIEYLVTAAQQYGIDPAEFAKMMDERQQVPVMVAEVTRNKALAQALERVTVVDEAGAAVDLSALISAADENSNVESDDEESDDEDLVGLEDQDPSVEFADESDDDEVIIESTATTVTAEPVAAAGGEATDADAPGAAGKVDTTTTPAKGSGGKA